MCEEQVKDLSFDIRDRIGKAIPEAELLLDDVELKDIAFKSREGAMMIYEDEDYVSEIIEIERDIKKIELDLKVAEIRQMRYFKEQGIKTVKEQENMTKEVFLETRHLLEDYKEIRDKLRIKKLLLEMVMQNEQ